MAVLAGACPPLDAQAADRPARVCVAMTAAPGADASYRTILVDAVLVAFARSRVKASAFDSPDAARAAARDGGADYLVLGTWRDTADTLELDVEAWLPAAVAPLARGEASGKVGLSMDSVAAEAVALVLPAMSARFPADGAAANGTSANGTATSATAGGSTAVGVAGATATAGTTVTVVGPGGADGAAGDGLGPARRWRRVEIAVGGAPLVSTGAVADYAKLGAFASLDVDVRFPLGRGALAAGLQAGGGWLRAEGVGVADVLAVPIGPDVHWTLASGDGPTVSLRASGGPAVIVAVVGGAGTLAKVSPFVAGGLAVDVPLGPALGLRVDADYLAVFEGTLVLQGFAPRLSLRARF